MMPGDMNGRIYLGQQSRMAAALAMSERAFRRWRGRCEVGAEAAGLCDRRPGRVGARCGGADESMAMLAMLAMFDARDRDWAFFGHLSGRRPTGPATTTDAVESYGT